MQVRDVTTITAFPMVCSLSGAGGTRATSHVLVGGKTEKVVWVGLPATERIGCGACMTGSGKSQGAGTASAPMARRVPARRLMAIPKEASPRVQLRGGLNATSTAVCAITHSADL